MGIFLKEGKTEVEETLEIKVTATYNEVKLTSNTINVKLIK